MPNQNGGTLSVYSLNIAGDISLNFAGSSDTLNIVSGGLLKSSTGSADTIGSSPGSNGSITTSASTLYIYNQNGSLAINANILGSEKVVFGGTGSIIIAGNNTYSGGTVIDGNGLNIVIESALPAGSVVVNSSVLNIATSNLANGVNITLNGATMNYNGTDTVANLNINTEGGANPTVTLNAAMLLTGSITATPTSVATTTTTTVGVAAITGAGALDLQGHNSFPMVINPIITNNTMVAPYQPSLNIATVIQNGGIVKTGLGACSN